MLLRNCYIICELAIKSTWLNIIIFYSTWIYILHKSTWSYSRCLHRILFSKILSSSWQRLCSKIFLLNLRLIILKIWLINLLKYTLRRWPLRKNLIRYSLKRMSSNILQLFPLKFLLQSKKTWSFIISSKVLGRSHSIFGMNKVT